MPAGVEAYDQGLKLASNDKLAQKLRVFAFRLKDKDMPDAETIQAVLGGEEFGTMGPVGVRPDRRLPISIPFADNDDKLLPEAKRPLHELGTALKGILSTPRRCRSLSGNMAIAWKSTAASWQAGPPWRRRKSGWSGRERP